MNKINSKRGVTPETPSQVKLVEVIQTVCKRGNGIDETVRNVFQYWSKDGKLLAEKDVCKHECEG